MVVGSIPASDPCGRLVLLPKTSTQGSLLPGSKRVKKKSDYKVGSVVEAEVQTCFFSYVNDSNYFSLFLCVWVSVIVRGLAPRLVTLFLLSTK